MSAEINISGVISNADTNRLNYIPGRSVSEQEFDLMQLYVDERCEDLLVAQQPGIVYGLEVMTPPTLEELQNLPTQINPGLGVSWSGKAVTNRLPIRFHWRELLENYQREKALLGNVQNGYYFLTLRRRVVIFEEDLKSDPCVRTELNPLRDTRLEMLAQVNLQYLPTAVSLLSYSRQRVAVRFLKKMLNPKNVAENPDEIKLALVKIINNKPQWLDALAGRFLSSDHSVYYTLLHYWHSIVSAPNRFRLDGAAAVMDSTKTLAQLFDIDCLPAAGKFPEILLQDIAGKVSGSDYRKWQRPTLKFAADGVQVEIVPVPANAVTGVVESEFSRGVVDVIHGEADRIRLLVAVNPDDYHPKLMDLPEIDIKLIQENLVETQTAAYQAYKTWAEAYFELYHNVERSAADAQTTLPSIKTRDIFSSIYLTSIPATSFDNLKDNRISRLALGIPDITAIPNTVSQLLSDLQNQRRAEIKLERDVSVVVDADLPRPWSLRSRIGVGGEIDIDDFTPAAVAKPSGDGLIQRRIDTKQDIEEIEDFILRTNRLIDEVRDYLSQQRQQLDSITVSFSALAGGIPGDGAGLKLMRWSDKLSFTPKKIG